MKNNLQDIRKNQIMNAAQAVVVNKGYDQSRMDDIVDKAKLSKGAIYWYYKSKKEVYLSLIDYWFDEYVSFWIADPKLSYKETISRIYEIDYGTNFLFNILLKYYFKLFNYSPEVGRFFPLIFGVLSIPLIGYLSYQFDKSKSYLFTTFLTEW